MDFTPKVHWNITYEAVVFSFVSASDDTLEMGSTNVLKEVSYDYS